MKYLEMIKIWRKKIICNIIGHNDGLVYTQKGKQTSVYFKCFRCDSHCSGRGK